VYSDVDEKLIADQPARPLSFKRTSARDWFCGCEQGSKISEGFGRPLHRANTSSTGTIDTRNQDGNF
jgi:hypothetical protein